MTQYKTLLQVFLCIGMLWLSTSLGLAQTESPLDLVLDPNDPIDNDNISLIGADQSFAVESVNPRHAHLTFDFLFRNDGPSEVTHLDVYVAIPSSRDNQLISNLSFSAPYTLLTDRYSQPIAYFQFGTLSPGQQVTVSWEGDVEIEAMDYGVDSSQVTGLDQIPPDVISAYTTNESMYRLESQTIQDAAQVAANGATNPYWIARNVHDFVANRLTYLNDHRWDDAETVYLQQHGSCSEYTILFIALCRANGLPARYAGGTRQRQEGTYVDTVFHRWAEVYLPPYGWIPVDVTHDDTDSGPIYDYFGALTDERFVTTLGGGDSEYLGWNNHYAYRYYYSGSRPNRTRERSFTWEPYPSELRVRPSSLTGLALPNSTNSVIENLDVMSTNGSHSWLLDSATTWLQLNKSGGTTPDTVQVIADTTGLDLGLHTGEVVLRSQPLEGEVTVPIEVLVAVENPRWQILVLIYSATDFSYTDGSGNPHRVVASMTQAEKGHAANAATRFFETDVPALTSDNMRPIVTIRYPSRKLTQLDPLGSGYWPSRANTAPELDPAFDAVLVIWDDSGTDLNTGQPADLSQWGGLASPNGIGQTYATFPIDSVASNQRNVFKHEWGHSILFYYDAAGTAPKPTVDNHINDTDNQYVHCPTGEPYILVDETDDNPIPNSIYNNDSGFTHDYYSTFAVIM